MQTILRDVRHALRLFGRMRGFTALAVATLALGIGASTAIYSVLHATLLRPMPFPDADRIAFVWGVYGPERDIRGASHAEAMDWKEATSQSFSDFGIYDNLELTVSGGSGDSERIQAETVSASYFTLIGANAARGRVLLPGDEVFGSENVVVISDDLWRSRFGASPDVIGKRLTVGAQSFTVVGVLQPGQHGLALNAQLWTTIAPLSSSVEDLNNRGNRWLAAVARLRPGVTLEGAQADIDAAALALEALYPDNNKDRSADVLGLRSNFLGTTRGLILILMSAVGLLLLIACVNVANLLLVRGTARTRELSVRFALGASRGRVAQQLITESVVLSLLGGVAGLTLAFWGLQALLPLIPVGVLPPYADVRLSPVVLAAGIGMAIVSGLLAGIAPAFRVTRDGLRERMQDNGRVAQGFGKPGLQHALVAAELALAMILLLGAGLMGRSFREIAAIDTGFSADGILVARFSLPSPDYPPERALAFMTSLETSLRETAGVRDVAFTTDVPLRPVSSASTLRLPGQADRSIRFYRHRVSTNYFDVMNIPITSGRGFAATDVLDSEPVALISEAMAARFWPGEEAVGRMLQLSADEVRVIGVVKNVRQRQLTQDLADPTEDPDVYFHLPQWPSTSADLLVRTDLAAADAIAAMRNAVRMLDPTIALADVEALSQTLRQSTAPARFGSWLLGLFAFLAVVLACTGVYGMLSFMVGQRRKEIAIRMAMGATPGSVYRLIIRQGGALLVVGLGVGAVVAVAAGKALTTFLYGVTPSDPVSLVGGMVLLGLTGLLASWIPARRATRVDPQEAFRS